MPSVVLKKITQPQPLSEVGLENITSPPLSYKDWVRSNIGIIPEDAQQQYEQYLTDFYSRKNENKDTHSKNLREDYINLVKRLSVIFKNDSEFQRFSKIDFNSPVEIKLAIPYFSKKLKEIALYYVQKRESIKKTKLQYASIGSETGLERFIYNRLLESFSQNIPLNNSDETYLDKSEIETLQQNLKIEIEELFEDENYYESGNILDTNPLFCVLDSLIFDFCNRDNILKSSAVDPLEAEYLCVENAIVPNQLVSDGWNAYTSNELYYISGGELIPNIINVDLAFDTGNNFFYWFSGEAVFEIPDGLYANTSLSSIDWINATAGDTINTSDIIFATYGNLKTEGAWLMSADKITFNTEMTATMIDGKEFKFPYPGYGVSAENIGWSGRLLTDLTEDDKRFFPNEAVFQDNINRVKELYWSDVSSLSAITDIFIQDLSLWESGAFASLNFKTADKLIVRSETGSDRLHDANPDAVYQGNLDLAWLYDFHKTQIPIVKEQNNIYFPLTSFSNIEELYFKYDIGTSIPLSSVKVNGAFTGAIAGDDIENSDFIIKKKTGCGPELEAAWIAGTPLSSFRDDDPNFCICDDPNKFITATDWVYTKGVSQPGVSFKVDPNAIVKFVWTGPNTPINSIRGFAGFVHDDACPYNQQSHNTSILDDNFRTFDIEAAEKWRKCSCRAVYHCPIGQKANDINAFNILPDLILEEIDPSISTNLADWRGSDGKTFSESQDASWFKLTNSIDKDVGWGEGEWVNSFELKKGQTYWYYRTNLNRCDIELPFFVINECYTEIITKCDNQSNIPVWKKAIKNSNGEWVKTDAITDMVLSYGDFYDYTHRASYSWTRSRVLIDGSYVTDEEFITVNKNIDVYAFNVRSNSTQSVEFLIKIGLNDNRPYWGSATYENNIDTQNKNILRNYNDNRLVGSYLISNQAIPSDIVLSDNTVIRYESAECNDCFLWKQPIVMNVATPIRQWNKILFSDCVRSDILDYLHDNCSGNCNIVNSCDCVNICTSVKTGVTATNEPSDMIFNVDLSGVPLFINYYARQPFAVTVPVEDLLNPLYSPTISGNLSSPISPWRNLINDEYASFVSDQISSNLRSVFDLGLFTPNKLAMGKYELHSADRIKVGTDPIFFRNDNYFDGPFDSTNINSEWMKTETGLPQVNNRQTYHPYQSDNSLGLYTPDFPVSPWELIENIGCTVEDFYMQIPCITSDVINWHSDIYGTQFFLNSNTASGTGDLYTKMYNNIMHGAESLNDLFQQYDINEITTLSSVKSLDVFYDTLQVVHEFYDNDISDVAQFITFDKLNFDYDVGVYMPDKTGILLSVGDVSANQYIGSILQNTTKKVFTFILDNSNLYLKIKCFEYDINNHNIKEIYLLDENEWITANFGTLDVSQKPLICSFGDIVKILIRTQDRINIFTLNMRNSIKLDQVKSYSDDLNGDISTINQNHDGTFIMIKIGLQLVPIKIE